MLETSPTIPLTSQKVSAPGPSHGNRRTQTKDDDGTNFEEVSGDKSTGHGYVVGTMANGDKMYVRTQGSATMKDGICRPAKAPGASPEGAAS